MPTYLSPGVYVEEVDSGSRPIEGVGTAVAAFVGLAERGPFNTPTLVTNWSQYTQNFGEFVEGTYLSHSVYGYFQNGGGACYVVRIGAGGPERQAAAELSSGADNGIGAYKIQAIEAGAEGNDLTIEISDSAEAGEDGSFRLVVKQNGSVSETFDPVSPKRGKNNVVTVVNAQSQLIRLEETTKTAIDAVARGSVSLAGGGSAAPERLTPGDYLGDSAQRSGLGGLEAIDEVTMVCVPDLMSAYEKGLIDLEGVKAAQLGMISHCELMGDRMAILDPPPGLNAQAIKTWRVDTAGYDSKYAALYWPWVKVFDPATGTNVMTPPAGHVAGIWGRNDDTRGVHKAPANEVIRGAIDIELNITKSEHDLLNPVGVNVIRAFPGRGIRIWGARTLSSDPAWRYINVRRLFNYLEESVLSGTDWVVFEPNDGDLWGKIRRTISGFLVNEWRKGALFGSSPAEAFYVKCDGETNPAEGIDAGQVVCEIGIAPVKPAEFVIFRMSQFSGGTSLVAE
ncbi:MAG: tail sheath protein [Acidimicrobiaceae bacterium]|nr:tail sheath protein [Acidimicrobiaceae bacterium]